MQTPARKCSPQAPEQRSRGSREVIPQRSTEGTLAQHGNCLFVKSSVHKAETSDHPRKQPSSWKRQNKTLFEANISCPTVLPKGRLVDQVGQVEDRPAGVQFSGSLVWWVQTTQKLGCSSPLSKKAFKRSKGLRSHQRSAMKAAPYTFRVQTFLSDHGNPKPDLGIWAARIEGTTAMHDQGIDPIDNMWPCGASPVRILMDPNIESHSVLPAATSPLRVCHPLR